MPTLKDTIDPRYSSLERKLEGSLATDELTRGLYATDASVYQIMPRAVAKPRSVDDLFELVNFAATEDVSLLPRGGGTSQNGQTVNDAIVVDFSRHMNGVIELDIENRRAVVQPGMVLDELNRQLKPHGLWFPVDVSTASRATIGGMCGNNSCGQRSIVYGTMRHNVRSLDALGASGEHWHFGQWRQSSENLLQPSGEPATWAAEPSQWSRTATPEPGFVRSLVALGERHRDEIVNRFPQVLRRVGGYNLDSLLSDSSVNTVSNGGDSAYLNLSGLLVGSEGTLATTTAVELKLAPLPGERVLGVCHFPTFYQAMDAAQHLVALQPTAVELVDATMIGLARDIQAFRPVLEQFVEGEPAALLLVEFSHESRADNLKSMKALGECMGDLGFSWKGTGKTWGGVVEVLSGELQASIAEVRKSGLNIMMSMKSEGKPVSFVEDCAVALPDLAEYTEGLTSIFEKHGTRGTWYAHASVGCLHVRPVLNLKLEKDRHSMREIADEAFDLVLNYKGSHSGEHGDGISRSEFHNKMFGETLVKAFGEVKQHFDRDNRLNPGKIVNAPVMNDRSLLRFHDSYNTADVPTELDWSAWPEASHGFQAAVEMCNNNGACRKLKGGAMCPSYRATRDEKDVTRGRANALRLALSGQLGNVSAKKVLSDDELYRSLELCVSCKACKRECPTGVDMARMKLEVLAAREAAGKHGMHERLVAELPAYAHLLSRLPLGATVANLANRSLRLPLFGALMQRVTGFSSQRKLPVFSAKPFKEQQSPVTAGSSTGSSVDDRSTRVSDASSNQPVVILWADTFNRYFEPHNLSAAVAVLRAAGYRVVHPMSGRSRPLCCGRTWLSVGKLEQARSELQQTRDKLLELLEEHPSAVVVGLEPSCLLTFRDELEALLPGDQSRRVASNALLFEEFLLREREAGRLQLPLKEGAGEFLVHGHCHQKAFGVMSTVTGILELIPGARVSTIESSCCGMAGAFGYHRDTAAVSLQMAELDLLPAVRKAKRGDSKGQVVEIVADGTSCRHQIRDGAGQSASHVAVVLENHLA